MNVGSIDSNNYIVTHRNRNRNRKKRRKKEKEREIKTFVLTKKEDTVIMSTITTATTTTTIVKSPTRRNKRLTVFPRRLYNMLEDADTYGYSNIISWMPDGKSFRIETPSGDKHTKESVIVDILKRNNFNQTKFRSFTRQLVFYNFKRIRKGCYKHALFVRGRPDLFHKKSVEDFVETKTNIFVPKDDTSSFISTNSTATTTTTAISNAIDIVTVSNSTTTAATATATATITATDAKYDEASSTSMVSTPTPNTKNVTDDESTIVSSSSVGCKSSPNTVSTTTHTTVCTRQRYALLTSPYEVDRCIPSLPLYLSQEDQVKFVDRLGDLYATATSSTTPIINNDSVLDRNDKIAEYNDNAVIGHVSVEHVDENCGTNVVDFSDSNSDSSSKSEEISSTTTCIDSNFLDVLFKKESNSNNDIYLTGTEIEMLIIM